MHREQKLASLSVCHYLPCAALRHTSITVETGTDLRGYLHQGFLTIQANFEMFQKALLS